VSPIESARLLFVSKRTVARLLAGGKIKAAKLGSSVFVNVGLLKAFLADQPTNTDAPASNARAVPAGHSRV
jgi:excisionase family DNA binding protein